MSDLYRTGDPNPPWEDPNSNLGWYVWQHPRFKEKYPVSYSLHRLFEKLSRKSKDETR